MSQAVSGMWAATAIWQMLNSRFCGRPSRQLSVGRSDGALPDLVGSCAASSTSGACSKMSNTDPDQH